MGAPGVSDEDHREAVRRLLAGLAAGLDAHELAATIADLHPRQNTFPGEVYLRLGAEVLGDTTTAGAGPIDYEGLRERHLPEVTFRGKDNRRIQFAVLCAAAMAGGLEPDLLDEVYWWGTDDFWRYGLLAAVALMRASADAQGVSVEQLATVLAGRHDVPLP
jgi:hypothetical protein